jgi:uncharacterized protein (TIGR02646 family)
MLRLENRPVSQEAQAVLDELQSLVDDGDTFSVRVELAKHWWKRKTSRVSHADAFAEIRRLLASMAYGSVRCAYCEDSAADEIEHIAPKTVVPALAFNWMNCCYACGPCNGPKSNRHAIIDAHDVLTVIDDNALTDQPAGPMALIDPRVDDYKEFLELDIGGVTPEGRQLSPTSQFRVRAGLSGRDEARARWTIDVLDLNREVVRKARETALQAYRASLLEYAGEKKGGAAPRELADLRVGILAMPHASVLNELIRQVDTQPKVRRVMEDAPEIASWLR